MSTTGEAGQQGAHADSLRRAEEHLAHLAAVQQQRPHHEGRRDGLDVVHYRQLNLLTAAKKPDYHLNPFNGFINMKHFTCGEIMTGIWKRLHNTHITLRRSSRSLKGTCQGNNVQYVPICSYFMAGAVLDE